MFYIEICVVLNYDTVNLEIFMYENIYVLNMTGFWKTD